MHAVFAEQLGRHVARRADQFAFLFRRRGTRTIAIGFSRRGSVITRASEKNNLGHLLRQPEPAQLDPAVFVDEQVAGFQIAMKHAGFVRDAQRGHQVLPEGFYGCLG